jgi:hypothetical protein
MAEYASFHYLMNKDTGPKDGGPVVDMEVFKAEAAAKKEAAEAAIRAKPFKQRYSPRSRRVMFDGKKKYLGKGVRSDTVKFRFIEDRGYETMIIIPESIDFKVEYRTLFFDLRKLYDIINPGKGIIGKDLKDDKLMSSVVEFFLDRLKTTVDEVALPAWFDHTGTKKEYQVVLVPLPADTFDAATAGEGPPPQYVAVEESGYWVSHKAEAEAAAESAAAAAAAADQAAAAEKAKAAAANADDNARMMAELKRIKEERGKRDAAKAAAAATAAAAAAAGGGGGAGAPAKPMSMLEQMMAKKAGGPPAAAAGAAAPAPAAAPSMLEMMMARSKPIASATVAVEPEKAKPAAAAAAGGGENIKDAAGNLAKAAIKAKTAGAKATAKASPAAKGKKKVAPL